MERTFLSSFCSSSVSIASLFSPAASLPPPPSLSLAFSSFSLPSVAIYPLSHFFFFLFLRCPRPLSIHFISLPVFGAISPLPRLSLIPVSPGFLSPAGKRGGSRLSQEVNRRHVARKRPRDGHESFGFQNRWTFFFFFFGDIPAAQTSDRCRERSRRHSTHWRHTWACHLLLVLTQTPAASSAHDSVHVTLTLWHLTCITCSNSAWPSTSARPSASVWVSARLPPTAAKQLSYFLLTCWLFLTINRLMPLTKCKVSSSNCFFCPTPSPESTDSSPTVK